MTRSTEQQFTFYVFFMDTHSLNLDEAFLSPVPRLSSSYAYFEPLRRSPLFVQNAQLATRKQTAP